MGTPDPRHHIFGRVSRNVIYLIVDSGVCNVVSAVSTILIARYLGAGILGQIQVLGTIVAIGILLGDLGNGQASTLLISRSVAGLGGRSPGHVAAVGLLHAAIGGLVMGLTVFLVPGVVDALATISGLASRSEEIQQLRDLIYLSVILVVVCAIMQQTAGVFAGFQQMQFTLFQDLISQPARLVICGLVVLAAWPWYWIVWGWIVWYLVAGVAALLLLRRLLRDRRAAPRPPHAAADVAYYDLTLRGYRPIERLRTGAALFTPMAAGYILLYLAVAIVWWMSPPGEGYASVGRFAPLWTLTRSYEVLLIPLGIALLPAVSDAHGTRDPQVLAALVRRSLTVTGLAATAIFVMFTLGAGPLLGIFGTTFTTYWFALVILAYGVAFEAQRCALDPVLNGSGQARWLTLIEWLKFALMLGLAIPFYRHWYMTGICLALVGAFLPAWLAKVLLIHVRLGVPIARRAFLLAALLTAIFSVWLLVVRK